MKLIIGNFCPSSTTERKNSFWQENLKKTGLS